jgi:hypothetical protein
LTRRAASVGKTVKLEINGVRAALARLRPRSDPSNAVRQEMLSS